MFGIGMGELVVILIIALLLFGASRLPEIGKSLGRAIREFKKAGKEITKEIEDIEKEEPEEKKEEKKE